MNDKSKYNEKKLGNTNKCVNKLVSINNGFKDLEIIDWVVAS